MMETRTAAAFRHEALLYAGDDDFRVRIGSFLAAGVDAGEPAFAIVAGHKIGWLQEALGPRAGSVRFADMSVIGRNPGRILDAWQAFVADHDGSHGLRGVGEPLGPERSAAEREECYLHEALVNVAFANAPLWLVCPYDASRLAAADLDRVGQSHPLVQRGDDIRVSEALLSAEELLDAPLPEPPRVDLELTFDLATLPDVRAVVGLYAAASGLETDRIVGLVLAASEVATNSVAYGGGRGSLRGWSDESGLVCELRDTGRIDQPLVGRFRPPHGRASGYGLWVAQQLCDLVQIRSGPLGTVVRLRVTS
jgi:anti-sigma regulatory factor (Ser/Thr protein kinase)